MKKLSLITTLAVTASIVSLGSIFLAGCGGGGGGSAPTTQTTNLYLFGTMSSNSRLAAVTSTVIVPNFVDYTAADKSVKSVYNLRSGILKSAGTFPASSVSGTYDNNSGLLKITVQNGTFLNISSSTTKNSGKGSLIATIVTKIGTSIPAQDPSPDVTKDRPNLGIFGDPQNGCKVNYAP